MPAKNRKGAQTHRTARSDEALRRELTGRPAPTFTARSSAAVEARAMTREEIAAIRSRLGLSQPLFAQALNVSAETVRAWEQGKRLPDGASVRLLEIVTKHPNVLLDGIRRRVQE